MKEWTPLKGIILKPKKKQKGEVLIITDTKPGIPKPKKPK